ncbi:tryptophan-rich sensory protein [Halobacteria archaeon AArc-m2/3/4]|uniref:Tryptophan-rich sensory protein n=1 Tax=Natronoglomus mannanivorans TaxID=2979990 RepID=A0AAP2YZ99_9EURY|nr:tryptophan-rich sensory protein [Halobacteria archaeon AArc-xg1-1]MCU4971970.1 tryptophan-rich sensory protein [Halobacteria archaeon AArc-m2/3/4]
MPSDRVVTRSNSTSNSSTDSSDPSTARSLATLLAFVIGVNIVGSAPSLLTGPDTAWFRALEKPWFYPPGWVFGVVWTLLFTLLGIALYLVVRRGLEDRAVRIAVALFGVQLAVNVTWTPAFFGLQTPLLALGIIVVLFGLVVATIVAFDRVDRRAAALLVPYLCWIGFATVLNYTIWSLNV